MVLIKDTLMTKTVRWTYMSIKELEHPCSVSMKMTGMSLETIFNVEQVKQSLAVQRVRFKTKQVL